MKRWTIRLVLFGYASLLLGCAGANKALADRKITFTHKQASYKVKTEQATKYLNASGDKYDSFRELGVSGRTGLSLDIPVSADGSGAFTIRGGSRALPVSFECDFAKGETRGELVLSQKDPRNLYGRIRTVVEATCVPLTPEEQATQVAAEREAERVAEQRRLAEVEAKEQREAQKRENERSSAEKEQARLAEAERERATRDTPQFKRNEAQQSIRRLRQQIEQANRNMDEERRVGLVSGYVNASRLHQLGSFVVTAENEMQRQWKTYKINGGQAATLSEVK